VAASVATRYPVARLISVAPQVSRFLSPELAPVTCPWLIIQGEADEVVSPQELYAWVETLDVKPDLIRLPGAGHFFHGQLIRLRETVEKTLAVAAALK
jgi:alpha/beta superfamily hydrolase